MNYDISELRVNYALTKSARVIAHLFRKILDKSMKKTFFQIFKIFIVVYSHEHLYGECKYASTCMVL